jgi:DNA-binding transcriptional LysR family regulator
MRRKVPSMETLIAFEAAARYQSFTRAADELALTQSAIGRQIVILEDYLGVPLFNRIKKRLSLTEVGRIYAEEIRDDLNRIEKHTLAAMARHGAGGILELAVIPTFANRWLIPRLAQYYATNPGVTDTPFDAAIHFGNPIWPGTLAEHLFGEEIVPVCSPTLLRGTPRMRAEELQGFTLLHQSARPDAWRQWFSQAGLHESNCMKGPRFEFFSMLIEAAAAGLGVALVPRFLVERELADGMLTVPCELSLRSENAYYLVYPESKQSSVLVQGFKRWLLDVARHHRESNIANDNTAAAQL